MFIFLARANMRTDADFLRELLIDWKIPFDDHETGRRIAVASLIKDKNDKILALETELKACRINPADI